jgi:translation initiation factor 2 beta subunit (eIF-2beta)/eIF-5
LRISPKVGLYNRGHHPKESQMSKRNQQVSVSAVTSEVVVEGIAELLAKQAQLKGLQRQVKAAAEMEAWEAKISARNPRYIKGSVRTPTAQDTETLGHVHGKVCEIRCEECGQVRVINCQDAFQVRYCRDCRKLAQRAAGKEHRLTAKLAGTSKEELERQIEQLNALLASKAA